MTTRATTIPAPARQWVLLTEPTGGATAVSVQARKGGGVMYLQGSATSTLPTNNPMDAPAAEYEYLPGQGQINITMADWFPDLGVSAIHLFAWCQLPTPVTVRHG